MAMRTFLLPPPPTPPSHCLFFSSPPPPRSVAPLAFGGRVPAPPGGPAPSPGAGAAVGALVSLVFPSFILLILIGGAVFISQHKECQERSKTFGLQCKRGHRLFLTAHLPLSLSPPLPPPSAPPAPHP